MMTIKNIIRATSVAVLFTAGLAAAQGSGFTPVPGSTTIDFSIEIVPTATMVVTPVPMTYATTALFNATVGATPVVAGRALISTNLAQYDVTLQSVNEGVLLDGAGKSLACETPANPTKINAFACFSNVANASCGAATVAAPNNATITAASGRRAIPLAGTKTVPVSLASVIKGAVDAPNASAHFTGAELTTNSNVNLVIEANIPCARSNIVPGTGADGTPFTEKFTLLLSAVGW